ncbi:hypothetical protein AB0H45_16645 [Streptomyces atroolivaceus]|uniref:MmyB family transcriptional regulator n=1 Tax=Streptomyces atroolivaceus TaxID=66869 RepID=UPI00313450C4
MVTNRLGDVLARTSAYESVAEGTGLLDTDTPDLTRYVFTDPRARTFFADWDDVADEQAFAPWLAPSVGNTEWFTSGLAPVAGPHFTGRLNGHVVLPRGVLRLNHPSRCELRLLRETLDLPSDSQRLVVLHPSDGRTARAVDGLRGLPTHGRLRAVQRPAEARLVECHGSRLSAPALPAVREHPRTSPPRGPGCRPPPPGSRAGTCRF